MCGGEAVQVREDARGTCNSISQPVAVNGNRILLPVAINEPLKIILLPVAINVPL